MEWYIVIALLVLLAVVLFIKNPSKGKATLTTSVTTYLRLNEATIVQGVYNALPPQIKVGVPSIVIAEIIDFVLDMIEDLLNK